MARRSILVLVALVVCTGAAAAAVALAASSATPSVQATAVDARTGQVLPPDPQLNRFQKVIVTAVGFKPGASVQVALNGVRLFETAPADSRGRTVFDFTVPGWIAPGQHKLLFVGRPARLARGSLPSGGRRAHRDVQDIEVVVPLVDPWRFRTPGGSPSGSPSLSVSGSSTHGSGHHGPPASTGLDVLALVAAGILAIVTGGMAVRAGRRRRWGDMR